MSSEERKAWGKTQRENRIIDIAQQVFFEYGYESTTIQEIANAAGYNKRTLYLYFKDKEEIFLAVVLRGLEILHDMLKEAIDQPKEGFSVLRGLGERFFDFSLKHSEFLKLIMIFESHNCVYYEDVKVISETGRFQKLCQAKTDAIADLMTGAIQRSIERGTIKTDLTPVQLMLILWGQVFGVMQIILMRREHFSDAFGIGYEDLFQSFMDLVEKGVRK